MPASAVSSPTAVTRTRIAESVETVPAIDAVACALWDGPRFAGHHRLVDLGLAVDDVAVGGDTRAAADEHDIARPERVDAAPSRRHRLR